MARHREADEPFVQDGGLARQALEIFENNSYKVEIIKELPDESTITTYQQGTFLDLCKGPHVESTGKIGAFKLLSIAGAYWRGDEKRPMLQRIYGTAWPTQEELDDYLRGSKRRNGGITAVWVGTSTSSRSTKRSVQD